MCVDQKDISDDDDQGQKRREERERRKRETQEISGEREMMTVPMQNETNQNISMNSQLNKETIENGRRQCDSNSCIDYMTFIMCNKRKHDGQSKRIK